MNKTNNSIAAGKIQKVARLVFDPAATPFAAMPDPAASTTIPRHFSHKVTKATLNNLFSKLIDLCEVNERLEFIDRPHLFIGNWRQASMEEFDHIAPLTSYAEH